MLDSIHKNIDEVVSQYGFQVTGRTATLCPGQKIAYFHLTATNGIEPHLRHVREYQALFAVRNLYPDFMWCDWLKIEIRFQEAVTTSIEQHLNKS